MDPYPTLLFVRRNGTKVHIEQARRRLRRRDFVEIHDPIEAVWARTDDDAYMIINTRAPWSVVVGLLGVEWVEIDAGQIPDVVERAVTYRYFTTPTRVRSKGNPGSGASQ